MQSATRHISPQPAHGAAAAAARRAFDSGSEGERVGAVKGEGRAGKDSDSRTDSKPDGDGYAPDLSGLHKRLLQFAKGRLRNQALAEDAVSETLLAAVEAQARFATQAQATAWLYGILRHKLVDQLRQQGREAPAGDLALELDASGGAWAGAWQAPGAMRNEPEQACSQRQFVERVGRCCETLSPMQNRAFTMREVWDLEPRAICAALAVSEGHLWVLVHRARQRLRRLLADEWLSPAASGGAAATHWRGS